MTSASELLSQLMSFIRVQGYSLEMFDCVCVCVCLYDSVSVGMLYILYISALTIKYSSHLFPQEWIYGNHIKVCFRVLPSVSIHSMFVFRLLLHFICWMMCVCVCVCVCVSAEPSVISV